MSFEIKYDRDGNPIPGQVQQEQQQFNDIPDEGDSHVETQESDDHRFDMSGINEELLGPSKEQFTKVESPPIRKSDPQESWKILREKAERAEKRAAELERALLEAQENRYEPEEDLGVNLEDDSLVEGKHLSKVSKKIQNLERKLKQYEQNSVLTSTEARLKMQFPDFDSIVSAENLTNLQAAYPEIANTINSSNDLYSKAVSAYTMIKKLGISEQPDMYQQDKEAVRKNAAKPKSMASISPQQGDSPLSKANAFANGTMTDDLKAQMWKEMNLYRKQ